MKMVIAIIENEYVDEVLKELLEKDIRTTRMSSTGGFLKSGNTTFLIGVEDDKLDELKEVIESNVRSKKVAKDDEELCVGGANLFVLDMDQYERF